MPRDWFASSIASWTPLERSMPNCLSLPDSGATTTIDTTFAYGGKSAPAGAEDRRTIAAAAMAAATMGLRKGCGMGCYSGDKRGEGCAEEDDREDHVCVEDRGIERENIAALAHERDLDGDEHTGRGHSRPIPAVRADHDPKQGERGDDSEMQYLRQCASAPFAEPRRDRRDAL